MNEDKKNIYYIVLYSFVSYYYIMSNNYKVDSTNIELCPEPAKKKNDATDDDIVVNGYCFK
jgi:hypothetical protein